METNEKPKGDVVVLVLWIIFFPIGAIIYACMRSWNRPSQEFQNRNYQNNYDKESALKNAFMNGIITEEEYNAKIKEFKEK